MSAVTRPPSVILGEMAFVIEASRIVHGQSYIHDKLRALIEECLTSIAIRNQETTEILQQAILEATLPRDPNGGLGATETT